MTEPDRLGLRSASVTSRSVTALMTAAQVRRCIRVPTPGAMTMFLAVEAATIGQPSYP